jgi:hypothetical protein
MMSMFSSSPFGKWKIGLVGFGLFAIGGIAGGMVGHHMHPPIAMAPLHPVAIRDLASAQGIVAVKGRVAESFGSRFVIDDGTGRTLVDTGPHGRNGRLAPLGAAVTVQGRFDRGAFHPDYLVDDAGTVSPLDPQHGFHHHGPHEDSGPEDERRPDLDVGSATAPLQPSTVASPAKLGTAH